MPEYNPICSSIRRRCKFRNAMRMARVSIESAALEGRHMRAFVGGLTCGRARATLEDERGESHGEAGVDLRYEVAARGRSWRSEGRDGGALIEGSKEEIENTFRQSIEAFFEMYPEI